MPYNLRLSGRWRGTWVVKIYDNERLEPPHVTIRNKDDTWRVDLRTCKFMDDDPPPHKVPKDLCDEIIDRWETLRKAWDEMFPTNKVNPDTKGEDDDD